MTKTRIEKIASYEEQIKQLENQRKQLIQKEKEQGRKDRTKRLCRRILDGLTAQNTAQQTAGTAAQLAVYCLVEHIAPNTNIVILPTGFMITASLHP